MGSYLVPIPQCSFWGGKSTLSSPYSHKHCNCPGMSDCLVLTICSISLNMASPLSPLESVACNKSQQMFTQIFNNFSNFFGKPLCCKPRPQDSELASVEQQRGRAENRHRMDPSVRRKPRAQAAGPGGTCCRNWGSLMINRLCALWSLSRMFAKPEVDSPLSRACISEMWSSFKCFCIPNI